MAESARDEPSPLVIVDWTSGDNSLRLTVDGYQFPGNTSMYDNEWLMVSGEVACELGSWSFCDPCFMSSELTALAAYLTTDRPIADLKRIVFTEPVLWFARTKPEALTAHFWLEAAPPWFDSDEEYDGELGYPVEFTLTESVRHATAEAVRAAASRYPPQEPVVP